jgi:hypothetical protein
VHAPKLVEDSTREAAAGAPAIKWCGSITGSAISEGEGEGGGGASDAKEAKGEKTRHPSLRESRSATHTGQLSTGSGAK